jgi:hypothetical protein
MDKLNTIEHAEAFIPKCSYILLTNLKINLIQSFHSYTSKCIFFLRYL